MAAKQAELVLGSFEDPTGTRCVDLIAGPDGRVGWVECRRDPEDGHGWRRSGGVIWCTDRAAAWQAASDVTGWLETEGTGR